MKTNSERLREKAAEAKRKAQEATDPAVKRQYDDLAADWLGLAEMAERDESAR